MVARFASGAPAAVASSFGKGKALMLGSYVSAGFVSEPAEIYPVAHALADETGGHFLDQFTYAERATDWRGNNNIAESIFQQMALERHPVPRWIVVGAGTSFRGGVPTTPPLAPPTWGPWSRDAPR